MWNKIKSVMSLTAEVIVFLLATLLVLIGTALIGFLAYGFYTDKVFPIEFTARMSITKTAAVLSVIPLIPLYGNYYELLKLFFGKKGAQRDLNPRPPESQSGALTN